MEDSPRKSKFVKKHEVSMATSLLDMCLKVKPINSSRHAACVMDKRGNVISLGENSFKTDAFQLRFTKDKPDRICQHAEILSMKRALNRLGRDTLSGLTLIVVRGVVDSQKKPTKISFGESHPCEMCYGAIAALKISKVVYSTTEGLKSYVPKF